MPSLPSSIFHSYDIRGKYPEELTDNISLLLGKALGTYVICNIDTHLALRVCVGQDKRKSGIPLKESFVRGVISTSCDVIDLGVVTTPMVNFYDATEHAPTAKVAAGISITASHIKKDHNGFKISFNKKPFSQKDYQELRKIVEIGKYEKGEGRIEKINIEKDYFNNLYSSVSIDKDEISKISNEIKISQDTDGDRLIVEGVEPDLLNAIFAASILEKNPNATIVLNTASSLSVIEYIKRHGGKVIFSKTGYPNIMRTMEEKDAIFGGEISGHFYFKDKHFGYSDGLYSAARLCEIIETKDVSLAQLVKQIPQYPSTPEIRVELPEDKDVHKIVGELIEEAHSKFKNAEFLEIDGVRITFPDKSWFLIRASGTENAVSVRAESKTRNGLEEIKKSLGAIFRKQRLSIPNQ